MAEPTPVTTLRTKRDQIEGLIVHLEDRIEKARAVKAGVEGDIAGLLRPVNEPVNQPSPPHSCF